VGGQPAGVVDLAARDDESHGAGPYLGAAVAPVVWDGSVSVLVRQARPSELRLLAAVEDSGGAPFAEWFGDRVVPALLGTPPSGSQRDAQDGVLLVAVEDGPVVGFVHVLWLTADHGLPAAHLAQVSVRLPEHGRRGTGTRLVEAACAEARWAGHGSITLCTYRDVPWNGPFYRALGFVEDTDPPAYLRALRAHEQALGLDEPGPREVLRRTL
jgi:GNAT superfamily N-acetyltransferase